MQNLIVTISEAVLNNIFDKCDVPKETRDRVESECKREIQIAMTSYSLIRLDEVKNLITLDGVLPEEYRSGLSQYLQEYYSAAGGDGTLMPWGSNLTTAESAELTRISRQHQTQYDKDNGPSGKTGRMGGVNSYI